MAFFSTPSSLPTAAAPSQQRSPRGSKQIEGRMTTRQFYRELESIGAHAFAVQHKLLPDLNMEYYCPDCRKPLKKQTNNYMRCGGKHTGFSYLKGSIFEGANLPMDTILELIHFFAAERSYDDCIKHIFNSEKNEELSRKTISEWYFRFREVINKEVSEWYTESGAIGGEGCTVQIDESKFGKRKYNRGYMIDGHWVFGVIDEQTKELRLNMVPDNERSRANMQGLIESMIKPGTRIVSDSFSSYKYLDNEETPYTHDSVNHSIEYVAYDEEGRKIHTNTIESAWRPIKDFFRTRKVKHEYFFFHLKEYEWRRRMKKENKDHFLELLVAIAKHYKPKLLHPNYSLNSGPIDLDEYLGPVDAMSQ